MMSNAVATSDKPLLLCFSHLRWDFVYQRPQHLLSRAAARYRVVFFEEPVFEDVGEPWLRLAVQKSGVVVAVPVLPHSYEAARITDTLRGLLDDLVGRYPTVDLVTWYYTPMALDFSDHLFPDVCVYDCMDELSAFQGAPTEMSSRERALFARADVVFCGGASLYDSKRHQHHSVHLFPSSVDRAHFAKAMASDREEPIDQREIPHPRVGFFGVIDERLNMSLIEQLADFRPDVQFILVGPVVKIDPKSVPPRSNIHALGPKPYEDLPNYLGGWDVGFMPFALNQSTRYISPTKTPEFLSAGLPLVSTPVADVVKPYGLERLVSIASNADEMSAAIDRCLSPHDEQWQSRVDIRLAGMSWDRTWAAMNNIITAKHAVGMSAPKKTPVAAELQTHV